MLRRIHNIEEPADVGRGPDGGLADLKIPAAESHRPRAIIAGRSDLIEMVAERLTVPGIGREVGSYAASYAPFYQGLFLAPHMVAGCMRGSVLAAKVSSRNWGLMFCRNGTGERGGHYPVRALQCAGAADRLLPEHS